MTRDGMPRAYLRMDPNLDQHPDPLGMVLLLCAAARQPERGRVRDMAIVARAVGPKRAKAMSTREDVVTLEDGRIYVDGWDEWQEGDWTVAERMRRMRGRRADKKRKRVTPRATPPASLDRNDVTTDAVESDSVVSFAGDGDSDEIPPPPAERGRRKDGTNPRAVAASPRQTGENPRANGTSPRQERTAQKRGALPEGIGSILRRAALEGRPA